MGSLRFASGELVNVLSTARSITASSAESTGPASNVADGLPGRPWISTGNSTESLVADLVEDLYGDMEAFPAGWTNDSSADLSATSSGGSYSGTNHGLMNPSIGAEGLCHIDRVIPSGDEAKIVAAIRMDSGTGTAFVRAQCLETRQWLVPSGATYVWQSSQGYLFSTTSSSWQAKSAVFTAPDLPDTGVDTVTIRVYLGITAASSGTAGFDAVHLWRTWDVVSIHGHNSDASQAIEVYSDDNSTPTTLVATATAPMSRPAGYVRTTSRQTGRYVKIKWPSENVAAVFAGEVCLWQSRTPSEGWTAQRQTRTPVQVRTVLRTGAPAVVRLAPATRAYSLDFTAVDADGFAEVFDELVIRTKEGVHQVLLIPDDDNPEVILGRVSGEPSQLTPTVGSTVTNYSITIVEDGLPTVGR